MLIITGLVIAFIVLTLILAAFGFLKFLDYSIPETTLKDCDKETVSVNKYMCYGLIAEFNKDISICDKIPEENEDLSLIKTNCYASVAIKKDNLDLCNSFFGDSKFYKQKSNKDSCLGYVAKLCKNEKDASELLDEKWEPNLICQEVQIRGIEPLE